MPEDEIQRAMAIGQENEELISLGRAWCTHIRTDRTGLGVGMVEEMTGLPITGGRFTCDYARNPSGLTGMQLAASAVGFYADNCRGCEHRSSGGRIPNLGTWAEQILDARAQRDEEARHAEEAAATERQRRVSHRTLIGGRLDAFAQEVVALVNRVDINPSDAEAAESLRTASRLTPDAFGPELVEMLAADAQELHSSVLLDVLIAIHGPSDPEPLHSLCVRAVGEGWGRAEGCRHLAVHGVEEDLSGEFLESVIFHAAPSGWPVFERPGQPDALRRYHHLASDAVEERIQALLRHGESWMRAAGAAAAEVLGASQPDVVTRLLPALLDGLRYHEDPYDHEDAVDHIGSALAHALSAAPALVEAAIEARWSGASAAYRARILTCLDLPVRHATATLPRDVVAVIVKRAVAALFEPYDRERHDLDEDYQRRAAYLLKYAVARAPADALSLDVLLGLLLVWIDRERDVAEWVPSGPMAVLQKMGTEAHIGGLVREVAESVTAAGHQNRGALVAACRDVLSGDASPAVRAEVVRIVGSVAAGSVDHLPDVLPLIYTAMLGGDQGVRAAGLEAAAGIMRHLPDESIPPTLCEAVVAGLADQYLIVVIRATEALHYVPADVVDAPSVAVQLLVVAQSYAEDRVRDDLVRDALTGALRFARFEEAVYAMVLRVALGVIRLMPPYNAREALCRIRSLREHASWTDTAIAVLRPDDDPQYEHLGSDDKEALLIELSQRSLSTEQTERLAANEVLAARHDRWRALLGADALAELGRPDLAAGVVREHLQQIPDTIERSGIRRLVRLLLLQYELEVAIAGGDEERVREIREEATDAAEDADS